MTNFYCEYCGYKAASVQELTAMNCIRHPLGLNKGKHKVYEGAEKAQYTCKYCGFQAGTIQALTGMNCIRHPAGANKGKHSPAL